MRGNPGERRRGPVRRSAHLALGIALAVVVRQAAATPEPARRPSVLLLVSLRSTAVREAETAFRETLEAGYGAPVDLHVEYLDLPDASVVRYAQKLGR